MWRQDFSRNVGIGWGSQDLLGNDKISLETSVSDAGLNTEQQKNQNYNYNQNLGKKFEFGWFYPWNVWKKNCRVN